MRLQDSPLAIKMERLVQSTYTIALCREVDREDVTRFLSTYWKGKEHILVKHPDLFAWQYRASSDHSYHFLLARHRLSNALHGVLGFIPTGRFDHDLGTRDVWLAIWKVSPEAQGKGVGVGLLLHLLRTLSPRLVLSFGINEEVKRLYQKLGFRVAALDHAYLLNAQVIVPELISGLPSPIQHPPPSSSKPFKRFASRRYSSESAWLLDACEVAPSETLPRKSFRYFYHRYLAHPFYHYECYALLGSRHVTLGFLFLRLVSANGVRVLRIVDWHGPQSAFEDLSHEAFQALLSEHWAEYIDFYQSGWDRTLLQLVGFSFRTPGSPVVVPNYFEPFVNSNVDLEYAALTDETIPIMVVKGDSDQDRPNQLGTPCPPSPS